MPKKNSDLDQFIAANFARQQNKAAGEYSYREWAQMLGRGHNNIHAWLKDKEASGDLIRIDHVRLENRRYGSVWYLAPKRKAKAQNGKRQRQR